MRSPLFSCISSTQTIPQSSDFFAKNAIPTHKHLRNMEPMKLTTYISTMLQQDLHSHILVPGAGQVQWCPKIIDWVDINTPGQQQSYNLAMPWMHNETQQDTSGIQVMFSKPSLKVFFYNSPP
jgi:Golgi nucleoside diphosphatase